MDHRLGYLYDPSGNQATPSFIDDDNIASYYISSTNAEYFDTTSGTGAAPYASSVIAGPRGTRLQFLIGPSQDLANSTYLFTTLGTESTLGAADNVYQLDSTVRITGATTGYQVSQPVRYVKYKSAVS